MVHKTEPVRELDIKYDDNGHPSWCSFPSHKNVQVRGACDVPPHLPGLIILVHGVNSTGEWYQKAESSRKEIITGGLMFISIHMTELWVPSLCIR